MKRQPNLTRVLPSCAMSLLVLLLTASYAQAHLSIIRQGLESRGALESGDRLGTAVAAGDFNGDGYDDVAMGSPGEDIAGVGADAGVVIVSFGSVHGITHVGAQLLRLADLGQTEQSGAQFGTALAAADFDLDGYADLVIGAPYEDVAGHADAGRFYLVFGGPAGLQASSVAFDESSANGAIENGDRFGASFAVGKFDAGGFPDLAVGAPGEDGNAGAVAINYLGNFLGLSSGSASFVKQSSFGFLNNAGAQFGYAIAAGNLTGSSHDDLVIGVPFDDFLGVYQAGMCFLMEGSAGGLTTVNWQLYGAANRDVGQNAAEFGAALAIGHFFDAGGYQSVAFGEPGRTIVGVNHCGRVLVVKGQSGGMDFSGTHAQVLNAVSVGSGLHDYARFGSVLAAGDWWTADGYDDLGIGAPNDGLGFTSDAGEFNVAPGAANGPTGAGWWGANQSTIGDPCEQGDQFGSAIAFGRFDGSNRGGWAVGAPYEDVTGAYDNPTASYADAGQVHVIAPWRQAIQLSSKTALQGDCRGNLLFSLRPFDQVYIASTTKIMTILLASEHISAGLNPNTLYTIPSWVEDDAKIDGSQCQPPLLAGEKLKLIDLMYMCLRFSGNDAAFAIADIVEGGGGATSFPQFVTNVTSFVGEMNSRAASLGMTGSHFTNPPGYDWPHPWLPTGNDHRSTAYDMWRLGKTAMANQLFKNVCGLFPYQTIRQGLPYTVNPGYAGGFNDPKVVGVKDGFTPKAKFTAVFAEEPLSGDSTLVIGSLFGTPTSPAHYTEPATMMNIAADDCALPSILFNPNLYKAVLADISTAPSARSLAGGVFGSSGADRMAVDLYRQTGSAPASVSIELGRQSMLLLGPGPGVPFGIAPFQAHRGFEISNLGELPCRIRISFGAGTSPADYTIDPLSPLVLPAYASPSPLTDFTMTLENLDTSGDPAALSVQEHYAFDLVGLGGPDTRPVFTCMLKRAGGAQDDGFWFSSLGRGPDDGSSLYLAIHDPRVTLGVGDPPIRIQEALLQLLPPTPSPFRDRARIGFQLAREASVGVAIYDLQGRKVREFRERRWPAGRGALEWDGVSGGGMRLDSGVYFYRVTLNRKPAATGRLVLAR